MKLNLNYDLKTLDGVEIPNSSVSKLIANLLSQDTKSEPLKKWELAKKLYAGEIVELDTTDFNMLKTFVEQSEQMTVLAKGQILEIFMFLKE